MHGSEDAAPSAAVRVSVIVPVFDPGPGFDELVSSLDAQTLPPDRFEVVLCDDGSGQPTQSRLAQVAHARANVRVLTLPHSGWPSTPRNHGIDEARGEYVFFADQDDRLFEGALEQLCDYADLHSSDVVIGKVVGVGRKIPRQIFRHDIPNAELGKDPLLELLTPHKLFRTSFLRANGIRFPDGRVRLEDHLFVMEAYFRARTISVLASQPCYAWLKNEGSASSTRIDPVTYFPHLEAVLRLVEANTAPGRLRDSLMRHWYRGKVLKRIAGKRMVRYPAHYRDGFLDVVIPIAREWFGGGVEAGLAFPQRVQSALLRAGRRDDLLRFAEFEAELAGNAEVTTARWTRRGKLELTVRRRFVRGEVDALVFETSRPDRDDSAQLWRPPAFLGGDLLPPELLDASRDLRRDRVELLFRDDRDQTERRAAARPAPDAAPVRVVIDPVRLFGRDDRSAGGRILARIRHAGWVFETPLRVDGAVLMGVGPSPILAGRRVRLSILTDGTLGLSRDYPGGRLRDLVARAARRGQAAVRSSRLRPARAMRKRMEPTTT